MAQEQDILQDCLEILAELLSHWLAKEPEIQIHPERRTGWMHADTLLMLPTKDHGAQHLIVEVRRRGSSVRTAQLSLIQSRLTGDAPLVVFLDYAPPRLQQELPEAGINYVDQAGNAFLALPWAKVRIQGNKATPAPASSNSLLTSSMLKLIHLFLVEPDFLNKTQRQIASAAGIAKGGVHLLLNTLEERGYLVKIKRGRMALLNKATLFEEWEYGYCEKLKKNILLGRFLFQGDIEQLPGHISPIGTNGQFEHGWGGELGAHLLSPGMIHPTTAALYLWNGPADMLGFVKDHALIPSREGNLWIYKAFSPTCFWRAISLPALPQGSPFPLVSPLLIQAELNTIRDSRLDALRSRFYTEYIAPIVEADEDH